MFTTNNTRNHNLAINRDESSQFKDPLSNRKNDTPYIDKSHINTYIYILLSRGFYPITSTMLWNCWTGWSRAKFNDSSKMDQSSARCVSIIIFVYMLIIYLSCIPTISIFLSRSHTLTFRPSLIIKAIRFYVNRN